MRESIGKSASLLTVTKLINLAISLAIAMLLSRFRTLEEYGTYSQLLMIGSITSTIFIMGLSSSVNYFLSRAKDEIAQSDFLSNFYTVSTIISLISGVTLLILSPSIAGYFDNPLILSFVYALLVLPWINIIGGSIDNVFIIFNKIKMLSIYRIGHSITSLIVVILTAFLEWPFEKFLLIFIGVQVFFTIIVYFMVNNLIDNFRPRINKNLIKKIFVFSIPLGLAYTVGTIHVETDKLMIGYLYNTETLAIYTNAAREMPITIVVTSIIAVIIPHIVRYIENNHIIDAITLWKNATSFSYILLSFFAGMLFVFAPEVISILYSEKYLSGVEIFRISSVKILLQATNYAIILLALAKTKHIFYSSIIALILNVILNYLFYLLLGLNGFAIATLVSTTVVALLQLFYSSLKLKITIRSIFPWKEVFMVTLINVVICISMLVGKVIFNNVDNYIFMLLMIPLISIVYIWIMKKHLTKTWSYLNSIRNSD